MCRLLVEEEVTQGVGGGVRGAGGGGGGLLAHKKPTKINVRVSRRAEEQDRGRKRARQV